MQKKIDQQHISGTNEPSACIYVAILTDNPEVTEELTHTDINSTQLRRRQEHVHINMKKTFLGVESTALWYRRLL
jgi:hypothetical protein